MKVVLGGSRHLSFLPEDVMDSLKSWMRDEVEFMLGEAKGMDAKFQEFFKAANYDKVTIYYSGEYPRHNFGNWNAIHVNSGLKSKSHAMHAAKDRDMTRLADSGLMMWDTLSAGTISNLIDLLGQGKKCQMFVAGQDSNLYFLNKPEDLQKWEERFPEVFQEAHKRLAAFSKRNSKKIESDELKLF